MFSVPFYSLVKTLGKFVRILEQVKILAASQVLLICPQILPNVRLSHCYQRGHSVQYRGFKLATSTASTILKCSKIKYQINIF